MRRIEDLEFLGGVYSNDDDNVCIPCENLEAFLRDGARATRNGKDVESGATVPGDSVPLIHPGPSKIDELFKDHQYRFRRSVVVSGRRIMKVRPIFRNWALEFTIEFDDKVTSKSQMKQFLETACRYKGLGPWRPRYGKSEVKKFN